MKNKIEEEMDLARAEVELDAVDVKSKDSWHDMQDDYKVMRQSIMKAIIRSSQVLDEATRMVIACPLPNQITAASTVIKSLAENAEKLMMLHEKMRKIEIETEEEDNEEKNKEKQQGVVTNLKDIIKLVKNG